MRERVVEYLGSLPARPGGTAVVLNLIRGSKVRAAELIGALTEVVSDAQRRLDLARHGADEARHAYMLLRRMTEVGFHPLRLPPELDRVEGLLARCRARDVRQVSAEHGCVNEAELMELTAAALVWESDTVATLRASHAALDGDARTRTLIGAVLRDDERHVAYLGAWLARFEERFSRRAVKASLERLEALFEELSASCYGVLEESFERMAAADGGVGFATSAGPRAARIAARSAEVAGSSTARSRASTEPVSTTP
jgi:hypothetical protein